MTNFDQARENMVECQIRTNGVYEEQILDVFRTIPRESFLPADKKGVAYVDEDVSIGANSFLLEPRVHARMLQSVKPDADDVVLNINDCTGYSSALFSTIVSTVVTINDEHCALEAAKTIWDQLDCNNIVVFDAAASTGAPKHGPYNIIFINGAVAQLPQTLLKQLAIGGRLIGIVKPADQQHGVVTLAECTGKDEYTSTKLFDAAACYVSGFEAEQPFKL